MIDYKWGDLPIVSIKNDKVYMVTEWYRIDHYHNCTITTFDLKSGILENKWQSTMPRYRHVSGSMGQNELLIGTREDGR